MEYEIRSLGEQEKQLRLTVPWQAVEEDYADLLRSYARVPVRGFRPGKTPPGMVESLFREALCDDLISAVATRLCRKALQEGGVEAGSPLEITESRVVKGEPLSLCATFIEMPRFELPDYAALGLTAQDTDGMLDEISEKLLAATQIALHDSFIDKELDFSEDGDRESAEKRVRLMLILKRIATQEGLEVSRRDIEERIAEVAAANDVTPGALKTYLTQGNGLGRLADSLLAEKVLAYLIDIQ